MDENNTIIENEVQVVENTENAEANAPENTVTEQTVQAEQKAEVKKSGKKKYIAIAAAVAAVAIAFVVGAEVAENMAERRAHQMQGQMVAQQAQNANVALISEDEATSIALNAAGINAADTKFLHAYLDAEHGYYHYEVGFVSGTYEYDFEIDATTGAIYESDIDSVFD